MGSLLAKLPCFSTLVQLILALQTKKLMDYSQEMLGLFFITSIITFLWLNYFTYSSSLPSDRTDPSSLQSHVHGTDTWAILGHIFNLICSQVRAGPWKVEANSCWCDWTSGSHLRSIPRAVVAPVSVASPSHHQELGEHRQDLPLLKVAVAPAQWLMSANSTLQPWGHRVPVPLPGTAAVPHSDVTCRLRVTSTPSSTSPKGQGCSSALPHLCPFKWTSYSQKISLYSCELSKANPDLRFLWFCSLADGNDLER